MSEIMFEGTIERTIRSTADSAQHFRTMYPDVVITKVDGREVAGFCEACGTPVFDEVFYSDASGGVLCIPCGDKEVQNA